MLYSYLIAFGLSCVFDSEQFIQIDSLETENLIQIQIHAHSKKVKAHDGVICHI